MSHPMWTPTNTNFVRALVGSFSRNFQFHAADGSGYEFVADFIIEVDGEQDRLAAGLVSAFNTRLGGHPANGSCRSQLSKTAEHIKKT
eukprot:COSAG01_NODE_14469_length_1450_cov_1.407846_3_plen_87_part_01